MTVDSVRPQWTPTRDVVGRAALTAFGRRVARRHGLRTGEFDAPDYRTLWQWSVEQPGEFWREVWDWFEVHSDTDPGPALADASMPGARWFPDARLNYVEQVFRHADQDRPALVVVHEDEPDTTVTWAELQSRTAALAAHLARAGVGQGDRVVGYLPNGPEAIVAFLAAASLGAVWAACGQDYSAPAALDRLGQLEPTALVAADGYRYGGRTHARTDAVQELRAAMPTLTTTVVVPALGAEVPGGCVAWDEAVSGEETLDPVAVPFDHPLWVVFSSGTTGLPKGIVHGHGGVLLVHLEALALQNDLGPGDVLFWYTSPSWMMWNFNVAGLLVGATVVTYDGAPSYPDTGSLWGVAARVGATVLGTSPAYVLACIKAGVTPRRQYDLTALRTVGITGATLPASSSLWLADNVGADVQVASISGGTDVVSAFVGAAPTVPVWPGELSAPCLGVALAAFDPDGRAVVDEVGELVVTAPLPSMPVRFWTDPDGERYRAAYFDAYPGVWRHGDWITITGRGSVVMHGRSDSTLNRNGIRMGSADIYQVVENVPEVAEALVLGVEQPDGGYWMPLFVVLRPGSTLDDALDARISREIRERLSPRHVPDEIIAAPGVPHTRTGKKLEVPIKRMLQGAAAAGSVDRTAVDDAELLDWYVERRPRESP
ncbi:acetoacetate--CoA ligase [Rhodococcus sp. HNM0569]|uniref:acetoacetate--CoA ligase n=1 Tax=Rhodococcus sp. HNM0569 TaxID=2716340 RepID=UPI00146DF59A|nr:acetoacetate--CoA ligase [Rhodococcus sp. HNM0569]NLU81697.1 acetoacetate--CoA ligase [Rhodococcus sp. HNM0569]